MKLWRFLCTGLWVLVLVSTMGVLSLEAAESGIARVWTMNSTDTLVSYKEYGPFSGWTALTYTQLNDGSRKRLLWRYTDGRASLWTLDANGNRTSYKIYGPFTGWVVEDYWHNGTSGFMSWNNTTTGQVSVWSLNASDTRTSYKLYGPYSGWTAVNFSNATGSRKRLLWRHTNGSASLWTLDASGNRTSYQLYGPFTGWTVEDYWHNGTTGRMVWKTAAGQASLWTLNASDARTSYKLYGPYSGWTPRAYHGASSSGGGATLETLSQETLVVKKAGSGAGTITVGPQMCGIVCAELVIPYVAGEQADVNVTPAAGSYFAGWETAGGVQIENIYYAEPGDTVFAIFEQK